jgi:FkbM family methyltransferase
LIVTFKKSKITLNFLIDDLSKQKMISINKIYGRIKLVKIRGVARLLRVFGMDGIFYNIQLFQQNFELFLNPFDYVDSQIIKNGYYEPHVLNAIKENIRENDTFWDIGANIGLHSFAIKKIFGTVKVIGFEPNPYSLVKILKSRLKNKIPIELNSLALSSSTQVSSLSIKTIGNSGLTSLNPWKGVQYDDVCNVSLIRADFLIDEGMSEPNIIKIDVEGHELEVLKGLGKYLLSSNLRAIVFEDNKDEQVHSILKDAGYTIKKLNGSDAIALRL